MSEKYGNNRYGDSTFNILIPFRPNKNHVYKITINECIFKNSEPTLQKGDWIRYTFKLGDIIRHIQFNVIEDFYTYSGFEEDPYQLAALYKILDGTATEAHKIKDNSGDTIYTIPKYLEAVGVGITAANFNMTLTDGFGNELKYDDDNIKSGVNRLGLTEGISTPPQIIRMIPQITGWNATAVKVEYSNNFMYLLNNKNLETSIDLKYDDTVKRKQISFFEVVNPRFNGAYLYVLETPIQAVVRTLNADSQTYNITALCYNPTSYHNGIVQMVSSMELTTNDLSHLRFRILNDQWEVCELREPYYLQITVSNED